MSAITWKMFSALHRLPQLRQQRTRSVRLAAWGAALGGAAVLSGCVVAPVDSGPMDYGYSSTTVYTVYGHPPPPRWEQRPRAPSAGAVWVDGLWLWGGQRYQWRPGYWQHPGPGHARPLPPPRSYGPPPPPVHNRPPPPRQDLHPGQRPPQWQPGPGPRPPHAQPDRLRPPQAQPERPRPPQAQPERPRPPQAQPDRLGPPQARPDRTERPARDAERPGHQRGSRDRDEERRR